MKPSNAEDIRFAGRANNQFGLDAAGIGIMATSPLGIASILSIASRIALAASGKQQTNRRRPPKCHS